MALNWYQPGQNNTNKPSATYKNPTVGGVGYLPDHESGYDLYRRTRNMGLDTLKSGMQGPNEQDILANDAMRDYWTTQLGNLSGNADRAMSQFDTRAQRGLANLLSQHRASQAGTGLIGSRQAANQAGDITQRMASEYMQGVTNNKSAELGQAAAIQAGLGGVRNLDLVERGIQQSQAKALADYISGIGKNELNWEQFTATKDAQDSNWLADIAPLAGLAAGALIPGVGPAIGLAGGGALSQALGGQGGGSNLAMLLALQNKGGGLPSESPYLGDYSGMGGGGGGASPYSGTNYMSPYWNNFTF